MGILENRYASPEMVELWSDRNKFRLWRKVWKSAAIALNSCSDLVSDEQVAELINVGYHAFEMDRAEELERQTKHDVVAHLQAFCEACPKSKGILHLGMTSSDVTDNAELIVLNKAGQIIQRKVEKLLITLVRMSDQHKRTPCLGYTHLQVAQPTTVGKRFAIWAMDLIPSLKEWHTLPGPLRGLKGATGSQYSFLTLLGSEEKVKAAELKFATELKFEKTMIATGQTYSRSADSRVVSELAYLASVIKKACNDIRFLNSTGEMREGFGDQQVGSSAMPFKRNPVNCETITGLARYVMGLLPIVMGTHSDQFLERTLDDSATRRLTLSSAFLAMDAVLSKFIDVLNNLVITKTAALPPELLSEVILCRAAKEKKDRQAIHERIRQLKNQSLLQQGPDFATLLAEDEEIKKFLPMRTFSLSDMMGTSVTQVNQAIERIQHEFPQLFGSN